MKKYAPVPLDAQHRWTAYRQVLNGKFIAVDKVEVRRELGWTATEIDKLTRVCENLEAFLSSRLEGKATRYVLLADELIEPFSGQSSDDFKLMQADLREARHRVLKACGDVLSSPEEATEFARDLDKHLPSAEPVAA